ncbi:SusD/RagB family nutrient-binding outer membrane lipoprotein [Pedobacter sp. L105]|uniref:SusD/RagB family nutrient-binding outer membrane lipoprotein n=1 Tax=Pedobacter sp. L105 TaxID=1641871 RepID=UPI00131ABC04|nr:SusD/RagB family nutrient-binding outer membrane lipoprotein [Pedobacter sp. L105]
MKKIFIYFAFSAVVLSSCSKENLEKTNTDPKSATAANNNPNYLLTSGELEYANTGYTQLLYQSMMMQGLASTLNYYGNGDKYITTSGTVGYQAEIWSTTYTALSEMNQAIIIANAQDPVKYNNVIQIAKINEMMMFQRITDTYGDVPFTQALLASTGNVTPSYDKQQSIYPAMLTQLQAAITALNTTSLAVSGDLYYTGDVTKWKKLGYSLMLRIAMRLTKSDLATAKTWAETAYAGGTMASNDDNAILKTDASNSDTKNANTAALLVTDDFQQVRWSQTYINWLRATNDPRLGVIGEIPLAGKANNADQTLSGNTAASAQIGMPNGYDQNGGAFDISKAPNYPGATGTTGDIAALGGYSRPRVAVYMQQSGPLFVMSYAESELLLAEAAYRGWAAGTAATHYSNAVTAALNSMSQMSTGSSTIATADIAAYVAANPLVAGSEMKMINEQYWATDIANFNFIEVWANWRRSGYPVLTPVQYTGNVTGGTIPRRMPYPATEVTVNGANYAAAVALISGGDQLTSRVYWDK